MKYIIRSKNYFFDGIIVSHPRSEIYADHSPNGSNFYFVFPESLFFSCGGLFFSYIVFSSIT